MLGRVAGLERATGMAWLSPRFAAGLLAQAFGFGRFRPVGGRGQRTVAAVLRSGVSQPAHLGLKFQGVIDQPARVGLMPTPQVLEALIGRGGGGHRNLTDRDRCA